MLRLPLLIALLLSTLLLAAGAAHGAPTLPGLQVLAAEEEPLEEEAGEEEAEEEGEEAEEESGEEAPTPREHQRKSSHRHRHWHKKTCRKPAARKHCKHRGTR